MFIHNLNPVFLQIGPLEIRYYGLVYALGFLAAYFLLRRLARSGKIKGLDEEKSETLIAYLVLGVIAGARLFTFVFYTPAVFLSRPWEIFMIWHGGMSFHGGLVGAALATWLFSRKYKISFYKLADILVLPAAFFLFLGRIANFINAELVGTTTDVAWCVVFPNYDGCRHPSQLYEAGKNLLIFFSLLALQARKLKQGIVFWTFVFMYGSLRFVENFLRDDPRILGLSMGQWLCIPMIIAGAYFLWKISKD